MYHSVEQIEAIFAKINPGYWLIREKDKNGTPKCDSTHGTFADCLSMLPHGIYNVSMRANVKATKDAPNYTFQYGDAVQGIGSTPKTDTAMMGGNWGANSPYMMMMMMMQQNQKQHSDLMMQMQNQQLAATKAIHDKDMQFYKLQMDVKNSKSTGDKIMGVLVNPNLPQVIASLGSAFNGQTAQVGRLSNTGTVPAPAATAATPEGENTEGSPENTFDPDTLDMQQRAMYDKGLKIKALLQMVEARFPDSDPMEALENGVNAIVSMDDDTLNEVMMKSILN
jgi:hypothetical protein